MESFTFYRDTQISMYERQTFFIEAKTKQDAVQVLLSLIENGNDFADEHEFLYDTAVDIGYPELLDEDGNKIERTEK